jgi:hypothetical protein
VQGLNIVDASVMRYPSRVGAQASMRMLGAYVGGIEVDR